MASFSEVTQAYSNLSGSYPKSKSNGFFDSFVCDYVAQLPDAQRFVEVKVYDCQVVVVCFNDIDKFSSIYCDYKKYNGKLLQRELKKRKDNFKNTLAQYVTDGSLKKVGSGKDYDKEYLKYEVKESGLRQLLLSNFLVQENPCKQHGNFHACHGKTSSDTGIGITQSDNQTHEHFPECSSGASHIDDQFVDAFEMMFGSDVQELAEKLPDTFHDFVVEQMILSNEKRPPTLSTAVDEMTLELTIIPKYDIIEGGGEFIVLANQDLPGGTYNIQFGDYGTCKARGSGRKCLEGCDNIPAARRRCGAHWITVHVFDENGKNIGDIPFEYRDKKGNLYRRELVKNSSQGGSNLDNEPHQRKKKSSTARALIHTGTLECQSYAIN